MRIIKEYSTLSTSGIKDTSPVIMTKWLGAVIPASYSMKKKIASIVNHQVVNQVTTISIRGREGKGKSTIARDICHLLHQSLNDESKSKNTESDYIKKSISELKKGYVVRFLDKHDLANFQEIIEQLPKQNRILVFDDLSFLGSATSKYFMDIKSKVTTVRHIGTEDFKTVLIFNFHQTKSFDNYLRDTHFIIQAGVSAGEKKNLKELYGTTHNNIKILDTFYKLYSKFETNRKVTISLGKKSDPDPPLVTLSHSDPFRIAIFFEADSDKLKIFCYPHEKLLGFDTCSICNTEKVNPMQSTDNLEKITKWLESQYSSNTISVMLHNELIRRYGRNPLNKIVNQISEVIKRLEANGIINFEDIYSHLIDKKIEGGFDLKSFKESVNKPIRISEKKRESFVLSTGIDGLKPRKSKAIEAPIESDEDKEKLT